MKKFYLLLAFISIFSASAQFNPSAPWMKNSEISKKSQISIDDMVNSFNEYWSNRDWTKKGSGFKPFMRWENHWRNKTNEQGFLITPKEMWDALAQKNLTKSKNNNQKLATSNWLPIGPFTHVNTGSWSSGQGRVAVVCVDPSNPNTIYIGSPAGGIWKSTDLGVNWLPLADNLPQIGVSGIAVDPTNSNTIYIATGDKDASDTYSIGVLKSTDGGVNWNTTGLTFSNTSTLAGDLVINPSNNQVLCCATSVGLYKTSNGGATWAVTQAGNFAQGAIRLKPNDPTTVYATSYNTFYKSTNSGDSFSVITSALPTTSARMILDVTPANSNYVYVLSAASGGGFGGIYKSTDSGASFALTSTGTDVFESTQSWYDMAFAVSSTNPDEIYTGCLNIWKSSDAGVNFTQVNSWSAPTSASYSHADIHFLRFLGSNLYAGTDGGVYTSSNGGTNFSSLTAGLQISQFYKIAVSKQSAGKMMGGLQDNGGHAYSGGAWKNYYGADGMDTAIDPQNSDKYYGFIQYGGGLYISIDAGNSASSSVSAPAAETGTNDQGGNWVTPIVTNSLGEVFAGYAKLYKLSGSAWVAQSVTNIGTSSNNIELIAVDPSNDNNMYVVNGTKLYKSTNKGVNFTTAYTAAANITSVCVHASNSSIVYITTAGTGGLAMKSINGGTAFTSFSTGLPAIGKNVIRHQGRHSLNPLYLGTSLGVYYRDDNSTQWDPFDTNLPNVSVSDLEINLEDSKITAATYGRGIWQSAIPVEVPLNDIKLVGIQYPTVQINCGSFVPQIAVKNNGQNPITSITVNYQYNGTPLNYNWTGTLAASASTNIDLPSITATKGVYTLNVTTTITSDAYSDNNQLAVPIYVNDPGTVAVVNNFESASTNLLAYTDGATTSQWVRGTRANGNALDTGTNNVYTTNTTAKYPDGVKAYLISQCYNLTNVVNPVIRFKMAFQMELNYDVAYVQYSTNFGQTWNLLGVQGTNWYNSNTNPATSDCSSCTGNQWTGSSTTMSDYSYPLNALNAESNVIFRIVFNSDGGVTDLGVNIDNFVIDGTLATQQFQLSKVAIYPNPSKGIFNIAMGTAIPTAINVYDLTGKIIYTKNDFQNNSNEIALDLSTLSSGIYFVKISSDNQSVTKRIIKN